MKQQFMAVFVHGRWSFRVFFVAVAAVRNPNPGPLGQPSIAPGPPVRTRINTGLLAFPSFSCLFEVWAYLPGVVQTRFKMEG
jgi:hypothetical protein